MRSACFVVAMTLIMLGGCQRDVSGKYLAKYSDGICWLQLVRTPDNHLTAQMETDQLHPDGKIDRNVIALTGAANGDNITLSASALGVSVVTMAGSIEGGKLTLIGIQPVPIALTRSDMPEYQREFNALNARSQKLVADKLTTAARAKAEQDRIDAQKLAELERLKAEALREETARRAQNFVGAIDQMIARMNKLNSSADVHFSRFSNAEALYRGVTAKITEYINRERQLTANPNAGVARSQLVVAARQASLSTDQIHNQAQSLQSSIQSSVQSVAAELNALEQTCHEFIPPDDWPQDRVETHDTACGNLTSNAGDFRQKYGAVARGLTHLEQTYEQERQAQEKLIAIADRLQ